MFSQLSYKLDPVLLDDKKGYRLANEKQKTERSSTLGSKQNRQWLSDDLPRFDRWWSLGMDASCVFLQD